MKISKTAQALQRYKAGDLKGALSIFATFRRDFSQEEKRVIQIAHETISGHGKFYQSIGIDTRQCLECAKELIKNKYKTA